MTQANRQRSLNTVALVQIGPLLRKSVPMNDVLKRNLADTRRKVDRLRKHIDDFSGKLREIEGAEKLGNFEIQDLMSRFNQAEQLAASVRKKRDDTAAAVISKI